MAGREQGSTTATATVACAGSPTHLLATSPAKSTGECAATERLDVITARAGLPISSDQYRTTRENSRYLMPFPQVPLNVAGTRAPDLANVELRAGAIRTAHRRREAVAQQPLLRRRLRDRAGRDRRCERRIRGMPRKARARRHAGRTSSAPQRSFVGCTGEAMGFSLPHSAADEFVAPGRLSS